MGRQSQTAFEITEKGRTHVCHSTGLNSDETKEETEEEGEEGDSWVLVELGLSKDHREDCGDAGGAKIVSR